MSFYKELVMLGTTRVDGVHFFPVDGLDRSYALDNGNAVYIFVPRSADPTAIDRIVEGLENIQLVKSSSTLIPFDEGYELFKRSRSHTSQALEVLNSMFVAAMLSPELLRPT